MHIGHISLYPEPGKKHAWWWVQGYTKNLISHTPYDLKKDKVYIFCQTIKKKELYEENNTTVIRCFQKGIHFILSLYVALKKYPLDVVHIQQEMSLYGSPLTSYLIALIGLYLKIQKKKVIITIHGVVSLKQVDRNFLKENFFPSFFPLFLVKLGLIHLYKFLWVGATTIIVHETIFKQVLTKEYHIPEKKIAVIPHGIESLEAISKKEACQKLGIHNNSNIVLFMGYATGYKWMDLLIEGFSLYSKKNPHAFLIIGAGMHPKLKNSPTYQKEYKRLQEKAQALIPKSQYLWKWFIEEHEIPLYYSASDVSLYPYTTHISSSWPMSLAISFEKPFLASDVFKDTIPHDIFLFERTKESLASKLEFFFQNTSLYKKYVQQIKQTCSWETIGAKTYTLYKERI